MEVEKKAAALKNTMPRYLGRLGELHNEHGPTVIYPNGDESWYINGQFHRDDGPAIVLYEEDKYIWIKKGQRYEPSAHELIAWKMKLREIKKGLKEGRKPEYGTISLVNTTDAGVQP